MSLEQAAHKRHAEESERTADLKRILLVEDDRSVQEALGLFFRDSFEVLPAMTGVEALAILNREEIAAVVLDYRLPDCTGLEVLTEIKATHPSIPVVMITGCGSESVCASALKLGVRDYFSKPFNAFDLVSSVRRILSGASRTKEHRDNVLANWCLPESRSELLAISHDEVIQKAIGIIHQYYWDHLTLASAARGVGLSKYRFSHRFKEATGISFRDYLTAVRLGKAKELLPASGLSVTQVAQTVGFCDLPRFDKVFKRCTGLTPSAYRTPKPRLVATNDKKIATNY